MRGMRWLTLVVILGAAPVGAEEEFTCKARLGSGAVRHKMRRNYALPPGIEAVEKPVMRKSRIEKYTVFFVDINGNGTFNEPGVDAWFLKDMRYFLPLEGKAVIELYLFTWKVEEDGSWVHYDFRPVPGNRAQKKTLRQFNYWRLINGLPPVEIDKKLSEACSKHCEYMEHNGITHYEREGKRGYTPEGYEAGLRSCIGEEGPGMSVLMFYSSFYHRLPLIHPATRSIGIGFSKRYTCVNGLTAKEDRPWVWPIIVPAPTTALQPTHFAREFPRPHPQGVKPGFPITITFRTDAITDVRAWLRLRNAKGKEIRCFLSSPEYPAHKDRPDNRKSICLIPREPLPAKKTFWVKVKWTQEGEQQEKEWLFATGRPRPVPRLR